jgi:hypothetical protein
MLSASKPPKCDKARLSFLTRPRFGGSFVRVSNPVAAGNEAQTSLALRRFKEGWSLVTLAGTIFLIRGNAEALDRANPSFHGRLSKVKPLPYE